MKFPDAKAFPLCEKDLSRLDKLDTTIACFNWIPGELRPIFPNFVPWATNEGVVSNVFPTASGHLIYRADYLGSIIGSARLPVPCMWVVLLRMVCCVYVVVLVSLKKLDELHSSIPSSTQLTKHFSFQILTPIIHHVNQLMWVAGCNNRRLLNSQPQTAINSITLLKGSFTTRRPSVTIVTKHYRLTLENGLSYARVGFQYFFCNPSFR